MPTPLHAAPAGCAVSGAPPGPTFSRTSFDGPAGPRSRSGQVDDTDLAGMTCSRRSTGLYRTQKRVSRRQLQSGPVGQPRKNGQYFSGKLRGNWRGMINTTWEARIKLDCLFPGLWPSFWTVNEDPQPDGEVDIFEWYGNGQWAPGSTVHAASNGKTWEGKVDSRNGGRRLAHLGECVGTRTDSSFWRDYVDGAKPYFSVPPKPIHVFGGPPEDVRWAVQQSRLLDDAHVHACGRRGLAPAIPPWGPSRAEC